MLPEQRDFHVEAQTQRLCRNAGCRRTWPWHPHHVVRRQDIEAITKDPAVVWDPRNCLRLCPDCHANHHGLHHVLLTSLRDANYEFAFELLGDRAGDYLRSKYDGEDSRMADWEQRERADLHS